MNKALLGLYLILVVTASAILGCASESAGLPAQVQADGAGSYLLGPGMPTVFTFDSNSMLCAVSVGTLGAPGPGPFSDPNMNLEDVNFGMVVFSVNISDFVVADNRVTMTGKARSITTVNDDLVENAVYDFTVEAVDGGPASADSFSMSLQGAGLMFDGHTFAPAQEVGLAGGDVVVRSE